MDYPLFLLFIIASITVFYISIRIKEKFEEDNPMLVKLKNILIKHFPDMTNVILLRGNKSYTINKKRIHLCLTDENGKYYEENMLIYVLLHELAHVRCPEIGHTDKFHDIFRDLLDIAVKNNIYNPDIPIVKNYCEYTS